MRLTKAERTTTVNFDEQGPYAEIVTYSKPWITSLRKNPDAKEVGTLSGGGVCFQIPKELIGKPRKKRASGRTWTPEQREAAAERMRLARAAK